MRRDRRRQGGRHATRRTPGGRSVPQQRGPANAGPAFGPADPETEFDTLYGQHHEAVLAHVLRLTAGDEAAAREIVKETFHRAWLDPQRRRRRAGAVRPWLLLLARSIFAERRGGGETPAPAAATTIRAAMASLSAPHRAVLVDLFYGGLSVEEVADRLEVDPATVKARLFYAMRALRMVLQQQDRT
ncbi:sigma factor-like helix-turn-helix DNA-binding protein [Spirilliplanes yamanashiensis]|uniref:RNA polymerase sigma factor n=1 Tax=Spirilliplanes yamanashiensis TaxID=42233 RepID=A0A8J3Y616_9ACTN|nr:sigma factor-like helix-turn-helix DNA-binding protein [Spirilliplanes yamanashiensis]MDP9819217.1 RNA polymerase sigma-70 factor (ECF subfamily) [Spirilliplanes yamanashiensis]GIJ01960.1 RNA polymerase sigma factor [Spirilliplanes yamanashiensis]